MVAKESKNHLNVESRLALFGATYVSTIFKNWNFLSFDISNIKIGWSWSKLRFSTSLLSTFTRTLNVHKIWENRKNVQTVYGRVEHTLKRPVHNITYPFLGWNRTRSRFKSEDLSYHVHQQQVKLIYVGRNCESISSSWKNLEAIGKKTRKIF